MKSCSFRRCRHGRGLRAPLRHQHYRQYRSKTNEAHIEKNGFMSKVDFRQRDGLLTVAHAKANAARSKVRSAVETVFVAQKHRFPLFVRCFF
jgi:hypothetical protein